MPSRSATEIRALGADHPLYPAGLHDLADSPPVLYTRGALPPVPAESVAIVGSRAASPYGRAMAERLASDLARLGYAVVSGLARGIDAAAHRGAMDAGGRTWAVLPSPVDDVAPRHHRGLAESIAARGGLLSEIAHGEPIHASSFIERNRLIAGLSCATVVIEAAQKSGALSTAAAARRLGRAVLAVPGDIDRETSRGCHALLRRGAGLCECAADVVRAAEAWQSAHGARPREGMAPRDRTESGLRSGGAGAARHVPSPGDENIESRLLKLLGKEPESIESLIRKAGIELSQALAALLALQWSGAVECRPGQRWARIDP